MFLLVRTKSILWEGSSMKPFRLFAVCLMVCNFLLGASFAMAAEGDKPVIPVGELAVGFSEYALQPSYDLVGKQFVVFREDGMQTRYTIKDKEVLQWEVLSGPDNGMKGHADYVATNPRPGIYFLDFLKQDGTVTSVSLVLDFGKKIATEVRGTLPSEREATIPIWERAQKQMPLSPLHVVIRHASLDAPWSDSTQRHAPTTELIGKRVQYNYSKNDAYEHVYLNDHLYTWHCIAGNEKGQADTEMCYYYKVTENLYLFVWQEKIVPTLGVVMVNLDAGAMKTTGKLFGYEGTDFGKVINFPVGAKAKVLSMTTYDLGGVGK